MFGFTRKKDDTFVLNQKIGRLLNDHCYAEVGDEVQRSESRMRLALPCSLFLFREASAPSCYAIAVTSDVSLHGMSIYATDPLETVEYLVVLGPKDKRLYIKAACKRCSPADFGIFAVGFEFMKIVSPNDYPAIVKAVAGLEAPSHRRRPLLFRSSMQAYLQRLSW